MTGWRLGWLVLPEAAMPAMGRLLEFNSSCAPVFVQRGGLAALAMADTLVPRVVAHLRLCRDRLVGGLQALPGVRVAAAPGGLYAFFRAEGHPLAGDSLALARHLVAAHGLGLAPGAAFGPEGEGWLRWCFASRDPARLDDGLARLRAALVP
jgi:aspartate/methionine/tyrosine aminotransferase